MPHLPEPTGEVLQALVQRLHGLADAVEQAKPVSFDLHTSRGVGGFERAEITIEWRETPPLTVQINNGAPVKPISFEVNENAHYETTDLPRPDIRWEHVDSNDHFHAYSDEGGNSYPTLDVRTVHHDCDGSCGGSCGGEGYTTEQLSCRICKEVIHPRMVPGPHQFRVPGLTDWYLEIPVVLGVTDEVSVKFSDGRFGIAIVAEVNMAPDGIVSTKLLGNGAFGHRKTDALESLRGHDNG